MRSNIRKATSKKRMLILSLLILLLCMSIGYSALSSSLKLNAIANVDKMTWDVHLENVVVRSGSVSTNSPTINNEKTGVTFSVSFKQPNEYYEFYIDVVNNGTIDAQVDSVLTTSLTTAQAKYIDYKITYQDETEIKRNDILRVGEKETIKVLVYIKDLHESLYPNINETLNLKGMINYIQKNDDGIIRNKNSLYTQIVQEAKPDTGINFGDISSDTNGKGVYTLSRTANSYAYPIYYYRGNVTNNNVIFGEFCWKILRTTTTGGIKLIYNGMPNDGVCDNIGDDTVIGESAFNTEYNDSKYVGYMYDNNTVDSTIKGVIDEWFANNLIDYQNMLEDTPFYNERDYVDLTAPTIYFAPRIRIWGISSSIADNVPNTTVKLGALNKEDIFTVSRDIGNGALTYPIGLLTSDEAVLAGGRGWIGDTEVDSKVKLNCFLFNNSNWYWTMSPFNVNWNSVAGVIAGYLEYSFVDAVNTVRPVVSLRAGVLFTSGDGSVNNPYVVTL